MGYRCWRRECSEEIPDGQEVWRDWYGNTVVWKTLTHVPVDPAPFHPDCQRPAPIAGVASPYGELDSQRVVRGPSVGLVKGTKRTPKKPEEAFDINNLPSPKKPDQLKLF